MVERATNRMWVLSIFVFLCFSLLVSCNIGGVTDSNGCTAYKEKVTEWSFNLGDDVDTIRFYRDGKAHYGLSVPTIEDVCPFVHVDVRFEVGILDAHFAEIDVEAEVLYGIFYTYPITGWQTEQHIGFTDIRGDADFGIKPASGDNPGWFFPLITFSFDDIGLDSSNDEFFKTNILDIKITSKYWTLIL